MSGVDDVVKKYGAASLRRFDAASDQVASTSSGVFSLDLALGVGGYPRGRIVEIFGPESGGKTTLALHAIAQAQKVGQAAFIDVEHALDPDYAEALGVDMGALLVSQPDYAEQALDIAQMLAKAGGCSIIVVDSVAALTPKAEIEGNVGDSHMGLQARLMSQSLRMICGVAARTNTTVIFINQIRMKIGVVFGNPETTTGGNALKFYASCRLDVRRKPPIKVDDVLVGNEMKVKVVKNKVAPPFKECELEVLWGKGVDRSADVLTVGVADGVVERKGAWFSFGGERLGNGFANSRAALEGNRAWRDALEKAIVAKRKVAAAP
jgi:recombination protein RecA